MNLGTLIRRVRRCRKCRLWKTRSLAVPGEGNPNARIFLVGEAPGKMEDRLGRPFVGAAGRMLNESLQSAGLNRGDIFITSTLRCRPPGNRNPRRDEIEKCRTHLESFIEAVDPLVVVALGSIAHKVLSGKTEKVSQARKDTREYDGRLLISTYHPAGVLYKRNLMADLVADLKKASDFSISGKPAVISGPPRKGKKTLIVRAAGGVIRRRGKILLIRKRSEQLWCLPKGHVEHGESPEATAKREMEEETGLTSIRIEQELCDVEYEYYWPQDDVNYRKCVKYFLARSTKGRPFPEPRFDNHRWCTEPEATRLLVHRNDVRVAQKAFMLIS